jgi:branched-chain amino acid transport system substrate-binding protein
MEKFVGVWWSGGEDDARPAGKAAKGYKSANFHGIGTHYPAIQDILKYVVDKGKSQVKDRSRVGENLYMRGVINSVLIAESIRTAQSKFGNRVVNGPETRWGMENLDLTAARMAEIGLPGFTNPIKISCDDHANNGPIFIQQWNGTSWERVSGWINSMDRVRPMLEKAAADYKAKNNVPNRTIPCS